MSIKSVNNPNIVQQGDYDEYKNQVDYYIKVYSALGGEQDIKTSKTYLEAILFEDHLFAFFKKIRTRLYVSDRYHEFNDFKCFSIHQKDDPPGLCRPLGLVKFQIDYIEKELNLLMF
jgi:hypothetical protein